ncbi:UDP-N-acetylmuramoyl-L-alanyl-D-glutamate--2,6-diaminopimelate ligase [Nostocoides sp. F2B08]|uniref:UDP-N-acetylmuramoyl-L-alanyl-D-glutamate--2, 6-diaminopimelate ligase n=1 Tax=Nostocoides sp. F2B08 TaxID=2653936 RepID=UPI001263D9F8|nr:UDP-N-acetylmuramoyl-L-alanyl-D-glutamate--2,6-diaminopimelate ligase [Tetrasphaera sp. F2B08]KAB7741051.1 UDP-N-acetylmuramoyl-L-alanyl-D-glutamate--2,6-diaminopimelate ligase [Tetrasphaera sp. F2B08]
MSTLHPQTAGLTPAACARIAGGRLVDQTPDEGIGLVHGVTLDSRSVMRGDLYAALPGANAHGADFAVQAAGSGAVAILTDDEGADKVAAAGTSLPLVVVADPRSVLGAVSAAVYGTTDLGLRMIGVTGTNGKTTTAYLIASALGALDRRVGLIGTVETRIGAERVPSVRTTPESCDLHRLLAVMTERSVDDCVMEVSSHALALHRVDGVRYDLALFTNLSQDHLDFHPDMDDYFAAKASLFTPERSGRALICVDDEWGRRLAAQCPVPAVTIARAHGPGAVGADYVVESAHTGEFVLTGPDTSLRLRSALPGDFNVMNTAMAAVSLLMLGHPADEVAMAVLTDPHVPGRMERVGPSGSRVPLAVVDYAHTPDAVEAAIAALRPGTDGPLVVVLGAGGERDRGKRAAMGRAAATADVVIVTDDNPRSEDPEVIRAAILEGARCAGTHARIEEVGERRDAIARAVEIAAPAGSAATIAVVGKGHETGQEIDGVVHPFDDRDELSRALSARLGADA